MNLIRHNLDVMHIKRNVFDNIFNTMMDVPRKKKDNIKACRDLKVCYKCSELHLIANNGKLFKLKPSYTLIKEQQKTMCAWVK